MNILALDPSFAGTGFAWIINGVAGWDKKAFPLKKGAHPALRFCDFREWLAQVLTTRCPDIVFYENPTARGFDTESLYGIKAIVVGECAARGIEAVGVYPVTVKMLAAGSGKAEKPAMQARAAELFKGYDPAEDKGADVADALCLLHLGRLYLSNDKLFESVADRKRAKAAADRAELKALRASNGPVKPKRAKGTK